MEIKLNNPAPDFTLYSDSKQQVQLKSQRGKNVLLLFFPFAFTSTCTKELCATRDDIAFYNNANAAVFGISVDSPHTLKRFREDQNLNFPLLSDFNKEISALYGSLYETFGMDLKGVSKRSAFVIDKQGFVRYAEVLEDAGKIPDFDAIKSLLASLN